MAAPFAEETLFSAAAAWEAACPESGSRPPDTMLRGLGEQ
jgi:hypothetical protein